MQDAEDCESGIILRLNRGARCFPFCKGTRARIGAFSCPCLVRESESARMGVTRGACTQTLQSTGVSVQVQGPRSGPVSSPEEEKWEWWVGDLRKWLFCRATNPACARARVVPAVSSQSRGGGSGGTATVARSPRPSARGSAIQAM